MVNEKDMGMKVYAVIATNMETYDNYIKLFEDRRKAQDEYYKIVGQILLDYLDDQADGKDMFDIDDDCAKDFFADSSFEYENIFRLTIQNEIIEMKELFVE